MKRIHLINKLSLRMRITLLTGILIGTISLLFTILTIQNAQKQFIAPIYTLTPAEASFSTASDSMASELWNPPESINLKPFTPIQNHIYDPLPILDEFTSDQSTSENAVAPAKITTSIAVQKAVQLERVQTVQTITIAKQSFDNNTYLYLLLFSLLGMLLAYWIAGRMLKPIRDLNESILHIHAHNLKERIPVHSPYDEMGSLAASYNSMLQRLEEAFVKQRHFSANVSHELKTPLAVMKAGIQVLKLEETPSTDDYKETIDLLERHTKRLTSIVEDLLLLTNEKEIAQQEALSLSKLTSQFQSELLVMYPQKSITLQTDLAFDTIIGSRTLISRALFNLLDNAYKYNKPGGTVILTSIQTKDSRQILIKDTGPGIPEEDLTSIFDPFYRVDNSRSRKTAGSGLGLSIVKTILDKHHWTIEAHSLTPGLQFTLTIPEEKMPGR